jgi:uncharacterized phage protein gp47/JayE
MGLPSQTYPQYVTAMVDAWAASLGYQPTLQEGDALYGLMETVAAQLVFLQAQVQIINNVARAQTSTGADLDTFYAQFNFYRLPAGLASGPVTFSAANVLPTPTPIAAGTIVQTVGGAIQYQVVADPTQPTWNASTNSYILPPNTLSLTATVVALTAGSASNVTAGQLSQIGTPVGGIATVSNAAAITNGIDAESDAAFQARFPLYLNSLSKATQGAIETAIEGVAQGINYNLEENVDVTGASHPGEFVVAVDNGNGSSPATLLAAVFAAVNAVRGFTILPQVIAVTDVTTISALAVRVSTLYDETTVNANVAAAVVAVINASPIGQTLFISSIEQAALGVAGVISVQPAHTTLNTVQADLAMGLFQRPRAVLSGITVGNY